MPQNPCPRKGGHAARRALAGDRQLRLGVPPFARLRGQRSRGYHKAMLDKPLWPARVLAILTLVIWASVSGVALVRGWDEAFPAMGALLLCLGFAVFLTDRHRVSETRRLWDSEVEVQLRMMWRYVRRLRHGHERFGPPQHSLDDMERILDDSFEDMMTAKSDERRLETYRIEMALSIAGTLQWGFGGIVIRLLHG